MAWRSNIFYDCGYFMQIVEMGALPTFIPVIIILSGQIVNMFIDFATFGEKEYYRFFIAPHEID